MSDKTKKFKVCDGCGDEREIGQRHREDWIRVLVGVAAHEKDYCVECWRIMSLSVHQPYRDIFSKTEGKSFNETRHCVDRALECLSENAGRG